MKPVHFVCVCLMLAGTIVLAQFGSKPPANPLNGLPFAQQPQPGSPASLFRAPQAAPFAQPERGPSRRRHVKPQVQNGPEQVLYAFQGGNDGDYPSGGLIFDSSGNLYGTTQEGGGSTACASDSDPCGTVFELSPSSGGWTETILHTFQGGSDGSAPSSGLIFDHAGNLYGTASGGGGTGCGGAGCGTVFELSPNGSGGWTETILYSFLGSPDGDGPQGLIFDSSGNLYGATAYGGQYGCGPDDENYCGTVFELGPNGSGGWKETIIYSFPSGGSDGDFPNGGLIFDQSGNLYGTTEGGGLGSCTSRLGCGTAFELSPNGSGDWTETLLYSFGTDNSDGWEPEAGLIFDQSGNLYGTTGEGGSENCNYAGCGTVFELSPSGSGGWTETTLYGFKGDSDGAFPNGGLIFDRSGNLYGTTADGGDTACNSGFGCGTAFELSPNVTCPQTPFAANSETSGRSRTPSVGLPMTDCQPGLAYPLHVQPTTPATLGAPVAQALGPAEPPTTRKLLPEAELQKPAVPYVVAYPEYLAINRLAHESFHGISGTYERAEPYVGPLVALQ